MTTPESPPGKPALGRLRLVYTSIGLLLGLGAPAGALLLHMILDGHARADVLLDLRTDAFFYLYDLIGTSLVFAAAGYIAGARADRLWRAEEFYRRLSDADPLTGLLNARAFYDHYGRTIERATKLGEPVALILIDVDRLKDINDQHGHDRGSAALVKVAEAIESSKRASDDAARWGGDEFAVLLDGGDEAAALRTAEGITRSLAAATMPHPSIVLTVTMGIASGIPGTSRNDLFALADEALYAGKRGGRNQVQTRSL
ncbi:MAG TPA: GGDEF domain-containing protein [Thermoanaerobaculia bacterium]|jgi:diguanylate cyclase (GGDEF)-like protein|nr:GGDEF domain-containing protein [Thermoanaerobaculia bacterium]